MPLEGDAINNATTAAAAAPPAHHHRREELGEANSGMAVPGTGAGRIEVTVLPSLTMIVAASDDSSARDSMAVMRARDFSTKLESAFRISSAD